MVGTAPGGGNRPAARPLIPLTIFEGIWAAIALVCARAETLRLGIGAKTKARQGPTAEGIDDSQVFRDRRHPRPGERRHYGRARAESRPGGRAHLPERRPPPPRAHRQGYAPLRLHDRERADGGFHLGRHGCAAHRPDPDAGRRDADPLDARRFGRDDLGLAQPLTTTTASSCSARTATSSPTRSRSRSRS